VDFTGTWKVNLSKSRLMGPMPKAILIKIMHSDPNVQEEIFVTKADGNEQRIVFQCRTDGKPDGSLLNGKAIRGGARWEGDDLVIESWIQVGTIERHSCDYWSLSPDGKTLSMEHRRDDLDGQLTILDKAG